MGDDANHFSCALSAVLLARVQDYGGEEAVAQLLARAGSTRSADQLRDIVNWISYDEAVALWRAGALVTHHPQFARAVGEDAGRRLGGSHVATLLRSLGSPEAVYRQIATTATKYSTVAELEAVEWGPGFADIVAVPVKGFRRHADHCAWTCGLLSQPPVLFGLPPARVEHHRCAAFGAAACEYRVTWRPANAGAGGDSSEQIEQLRSQLDAMKERLHSMFDTAADLIGAGRLEEVLARIAERAAVEVRAPRYLLTVRMTPDGERLCHHRGFREEDVDGYATELLRRHPAQHPDSWLVVAVRSNRRDYGRLLAMYDEGVRFFPEERDLLEVYARYAASALDSASALREAEERYAQSSALLRLARALAAAGTSAEVARRLADSVPVVVDCDRVGVHLWDATAGELAQEAITESGDTTPQRTPGATRWKPSPGGALERLLLDPKPDPIFVDAQTGDDALRRLIVNRGLAATMLVPLATPGRFLGLLTVSVDHGPARLAPGPDLLDRLSGVAAQATTALQNGQLVDQITYQALHDQLTGLANRVQFTTELRSAVHQARQREGSVTLFYLDLDRFKPVNDEYGHDAGDELLTEFAARLKSCTRGEDLVARLGGDEFAVLLSTPTADDVEKLGRRIAAAVAEPFGVGGRTVAVGVSVGRAVYPLDADDADGLLRNADAAMFEVKRRRRTEPGQTQGRAVTATR
ncbi:MAG TPA: diguanylate cyclase [Solirubrobacteraceae bacterium]|jgi:diguanylate cyclase (GGDEF)-like protein